MRVMESGLKKEILEVTFEEKNIDDILNMTVDDAVTFFSTHEQHKIAQKLKPLQDVGLGYIQLGSPPLPSLVEKHNA